MPVFQEIPRWRFLATFFAAMGVLPTLGAAEPGDVKVLARAAVDPCVVAGVLVQNH